MVILVNYDKIITPPEHILIRAGNFGYHRGRNHTSSTQWARVGQLSSCSKRLSRVYGIATFVRSSATWQVVASSRNDDSIEWVSTNVEGVINMNVYKPPGIPLCVDSIPHYLQLCTHRGEFQPP